MTKSLDLDNLCKAKEEKCISKEPSGEDSRELGAILDPKVKRYGNMWDIECR